MARERKSAASKGGSAYRQSAGLVHLDLLLTEAERHAVRQAAAAADVRSVTGFAKSLLLGNSQVRRFLKKLPESS
jgi:hypothetical protein